ncbi:hypothetical protein [Streptomyces atratus]|uniref:Uncharacterized protein n=1 Tax=Streptomyces atratus TaxID=1893 RepID=A0A2Z5JPT2_STRAR|nr:hypothetical protein [Streptomyces atratus]AXE82254.1 hypothetical protein C5746_41460 [Streptomyces atratus]
MPRWPWRQQSRPGACRTPDRSKRHARRSGSTGTEAAILLFQVVSEVTEELGDKTTSETSAADGEDIEDAEIVHKHLAALQEALKALNTVNRAVIKDLFTQAAAHPDDGAEYERVHQAVIKKTTAIRI